MEYVLVDPTNPSNAGGFFTGHESVDFMNAKTIVFWANNVAETSIPDWRVMCDARDQNGTRLIAVDPRFTVTCAQSDDWVPIRPGADTALIDGIINQVFQNGTYDADYIRANTVGPYLIDPRTQKWLRAKDVIPGAKDDYVAVLEEETIQRLPGSASACCGFCAIAETCITRSPCSIRRRPRA